MTPLAFSESSCCEFCGSHVTDRFCRVFGDDDDRVSRCPECDTWVRIHEGSAAGRDVSTPDPRTSPGRHGGETA
jgi:hypothetical protein